MSNIIAETQRIVLRLIEDADRDLIFKLSKESMMISALPQDDKFQEMYKQTCWEEVNRPSIFNVLIFLKDTGEFIGKICMQFIDDPLPELGIDLLKKFQNFGYGPEAIIAFANWYGQVHSLSQIRVRISKENDHSRHVFEKLGAVYSEDTPSVNPGFVAMMKDLLPDADISALTLNNVRDYILHLPVIEQGV
ncbi:MAG: GNAT family N-acetyltransferase [Ruminococcaceae bacterium]|nr:GNAT family N-acetyltransferase [Oscillospiraceae bacterium]